MASDVDMDEIARRTDGFTGADLASLANEAVMLAIRNLVAKGKTMTEEELKTEKVNMSCFQKAMEKVKPISRMELGKFEKAAEDFINVR